MNSLFKLSMAVLLGAMALCTYVTVASGLIDKLAYQSYTHEAGYSVVDVDARGKVTVEYTVDGGHSRTSSSFTIWQLCSR